MISGLSKLIFVRNAHGNYWSLRIIPRMGGDSVGKTGMSCDEISTKKYNNASSNEPAGGRKDSRQVEVEMMIVTCLQRG